MTSTNLSVVQKVRCLECGAVYAKPASGGTVRANPGCPECGYLGWLAASIPFRRAGAQSHYASDHPSRRTA